jgi:hypothetical protein
MSMPPTRTRPALGASVPVRMRMVVVLPAPFGPRNPSTSPFTTLKLTSRSTGRWPKLRQT